MRAAYAISLVAILCSSATVGQWFNNDFLGLRNTFANLHGTIQHSVDQLNHQIRSNVRNYFTEVEDFHQGLRRKLGPSMPVVTEIGRGGNAIVISSNSAHGTGGSAGASRTVYSGYTPDGEPYYRDSERRVVNGILHHFEKVYDPATKKYKEYHYTLDLNDPKAKPIEVRIDSDEQEKEVSKETVETKETPHTKETVETQETVDTKETTEKKEIKE